MFGNTWQFLSQTDGYREPVNLGDALRLGVGGGRVSDAYGQPTSLVNTLVPVMFIIAGLIFMIMIIVSGYKFIQDGTKGKEEAQTILTTAASGLIVMFAAYWIVQIVGILTGQGQILTF